MNDDWRVEVHLHEPESARALAERLEAGELDHGLPAGFDSRVVVTHDGPTVFCYAASQEQAVATRRAVDQLIGERGLQATTRLTRWHPEAEEWEDPGAPLPHGAEEDPSEHAERIQGERADSRERGYPEWEVRVQCDSHRHAEAMARRLDADGIPYLKRWRYLLVGALDEDSAEALAERIRSEVPEGSRVTVEGSLRSVMDASPFALFSWPSG